MSRNNESRGREIMPPIVTIIIVLMIISAIGIIRVGLWNDRNRETQKPNNTILSENKNLNTNENEVLTILLDGKEESDFKTMPKENTYFIYIKCLKDYFSDPQVLLDNNKGKEVVE